MKTIYTSILAILISVISIAQNAQVVVFKHELRWTDENRFPNYFLYQDIRDSIFNDTKLELMKYLKVADVKLPDEVSYKIINGFGGQKTELPQTVSNNDFEIGIFSFITRATTGYAMSWKLNIIIRKNNKIFLKKEVKHELEYFNASGYLTSQLWITPEQFHAIFQRLTKEALGELPDTNEKIILGSLETEEKKASSLLLNPTRELLKINGAWKSATDFSALLEKDNDTIFDFNHSDKMIWEFPKPTLSDFLNPLILENTGINITLNEKITHQKKSTIVFSDEQKLGIDLKWIEQGNSIETPYFTMSNYKVTNPLIAELYSDKNQIGYFLYTRLEDVHTTDKTTTNTNPFTGSQTQNTLGIEQIHRIEGALKNKPLFAEYNEGRGIIEIRSGEERLGVMVVQNCNPENQSISKTSLTKNKTFIITSNANFGGHSLSNTKSIEWYPIYFPENSTEESKKTCIETLVCLFFGIGNM